MSLSLNQVGEKEGNFTSERNNSKGGERCGDILEDELLCCSKASEHMATTSSILVDSVFCGENWVEGYLCVNSQLKDNHESLVN